MAQAAAACCCRHGTGGAARYRVPARRAVDCTQVWWHMRQCRGTHPRGRVRGHAGARACCQPAAVLQRCIACWYLALLRHYRLRDARRQPRNSQKLRYPQSVKGMLGRGYVLRVQQVAGWALRAALCTHGAQLRCSVKMTVGLPCALCAKNGIAVCYTLAALASLCCDIPLDCACLPRRSKGRAPMSLVLCACCVRRGLMFKVWVEASKQAFCKAVFGLVGIAEQHHVAPAVHCTLQCYAVGWQAQLCVGERNGQHQSNRLQCAFLKLLPLGADARGMEAR